MPITTRKETLAAALTVVLVAVPVYLLRLNGVAGMMVDDAWYALLAKALADGAGFRLISSPAEAILPMYPPGFPTVLSMGFRAFPEFPDNVWLLKSVSMAAMLGVGVLTYRYLRSRQLVHEIAVSAALATAILPAFVFLATSTLMSECVFTFIQLAAVVLLHRSVESRDPRHGLQMVAMAAVVAAAAVLVRSAAAGLIVASTLWLLKERLWPRAALFAATVVLCLLPWLVYSGSNAPTAEQRAAHGGHVAYSYGEQFWMKWAGAPASGRVTVRDLPARVAANAVDVFARSVGGIFVPVTLRGPNEGGEEVVGLGPGSNMGDTAAPMAIALVLSAIALAGFITTARRRITVAEFLVPVSIAIVLVWPFWSFRFVLPLTPFLFLYLVTGLEWLTRSLRVVRMTLLCVIGLSLFDHVSYVVHARNGGAVEWLDSARQADAALDWVRTNLPDEGTIASTNPGLLYLRTGRRSMSYDDPTIQLTTWKARGFRYVICLRPAEMPTAPPGAYKILYQSPARLWVIEL